MEMVTEEPDDEQVTTVFKEITAYYSLSSINSDYRTLALWPDYLLMAWGRLKQRSQTPAYGQAIHYLQEETRARARSLPLPIVLSRADFDERITDAAAVRDKIADFERLLPPMMLNVALMALDWQPADRLVHSPFPIGAP